jgi:hypothetical protein
MKQGSQIDHTEFVQPWIMLLLNFFMENSDKEDLEGSFKPLNVVTGWMVDNEKEMSCM